MNNSNPSANPRSHASHLGLEKDLPNRFASNPIDLLGKLIAQGDYGKLKSLLEKAASSNTKITDNQIYEMLGQVMTLYEHEEKNQPTYAEELLNILFHILSNSKSRCGMHQAFKGAFSIKKYGDQANTIIHLAVDRANLDIVKCLINWYLKQHGDNNHTDEIRLAQMGICSIRNALGQTPLSRVVKDYFSHPLICSKHQCMDGHCHDFIHEEEGTTHEPHNRCMALHYVIESEYEHHEDECDAYQHAIEMRMRREEIILYLLDLGVPWFEKSSSQTPSVLHDAIKYHAPDLLVSMMNVIRKREISPHNLKDQVRVIDEQGFSLLSYAVLCRNHDLVQALCSAGACPISCNRTSFNDKSLSPIACAMAFRDTAMVKCLVKAECSSTCNIHSIDQSIFPQTIRDVVASKHAGKIICCLKEYCQRTQNKYDLTIVPKSWDWSPNPDITKLVNELITIQKSVNDQDPKKAKPVYAALHTRSNKKNTSHTNLNPLSPESSRCGTAHSVCSTFSLGAGATGVLREVISKGYQQL